MSISSAMTAALSGLGVAARNAQVVSGNVANALTEGYARRELQRTTQVLDGQGGGVRVAGIARHSDPGLLEDRRAADAQLAAADIAAAFEATARRTIGLPGEEGSLADRLARFDSALIAAASRPDSAARLEEVSARARALADGLNGAAAMVQQERMRADRAIADAVSKLNESLVRLGDLNGEIARLSSARRDVSALVDEQQRLVDGIAELVPVRVVPRDHGQIALYAAGGAILLDGRPARFDFVAAGVITADMTLADGTLSGLTMNGRPISTSGPGAHVGGGALAALFSVRDEQAPALQARLDALARDLAERLADPAGDPTLAPGDTGVFTDAGAAVLPGNERGLAARIALNPALEPLQAELWRWRDGINAPAPGEPGDARILQARRAALEAPRVPASGGFGPGPRSAAALMSDLLSGMAVDQQAREGERSFAAARAEALRTLELESGVDTDQELQILMQVEQAFAANARVLTTLDELLQMITRI